MDKVLKIDVDAVIRSRAGNKSRFIPRFLTRLIEKIICQEQLNEMLVINHGKKGADFCRGTVDALGITAGCYGTDNLPPLSDRPLFVCNHPLGGLDGMILIDLITRHYGVPVKFVVNDLLLAVSPLRDVFLPVNHHGAQNKEKASEIEEAFSSDTPIIIFPAGLVSRKQADGTIKDLKWHKMFVKKAIKYNRTVIPTRFIGLNSPFFYNFAHIRRKSGIKFNLDMFLLPREIFNSRGKHFEVVFGKPFEQRFLTGDTPENVAAESRETIYTLLP